MKISKLLLISLIIASSLRAMDEEDSWLRSPASTRTMVYDIIKDNAQEIISKDLISVPEYQASECRAAYSMKLLDLYKQHNPTSKHYANAAKWALAEKVTPPVRPSDAHQLLTDHPITFSKDNPFDKELLWNIAAAAIVKKHNELKQCTNALMETNRIPPPDSNFMTYLLSYVIMEKVDSALDTYVDMGARIEGIKKYSPFTPWLVGCAKEQKVSLLFRSLSNTGRADYACPLDCAIRSANKDALAWLKTKQPRVLSDQVWHYYLKKFARDRDIALWHREYSVLAILDLNPDLILDEEMANTLHASFDAPSFHSSEIRERVYPRTSTSYSLGVNVASLLGLPTPPFTPEAHTNRGDDAV
jgi:hypothetical protein